MSLENALPDLNISKGEHKLTDNTTNESAKHTNNNPAFEHVEKKYGIDCVSYGKLSNIIHGHSIAAATEFSNILGKDTNEDIIHFFFDYFLCFYVTVKKDYFHFDNKDAFSALVDGMHIEHYGNVSNKIIESIIGLWGSNINCFLKTDMAAFKNRDTADRIRLSVDLAAYCVNKEEMLGATEVVGLMTQFKNIQNSKLSSIDTFFQIIRKN